MDSGMKNLPAVTESRSTLPSISSRAADIFDLVPVTKSEFASEIGPILSLLAPTGMGQDERKTWLSGAFKALDGIPIGLLQRGVAAAYRKADHPAKVVKAIFDEIESEWDWRKRTPRPKNDQPIAEPVKFEEISEDERAEVAALMSDLARKLSMKEERR